MITRKNSSAVRKNLPLHECFAQIYFTILEYLISIIDKIEIAIVILNQLIRLLPYTIDVEVVIVWTCIENSHAVITTIIIYKGVSSKGTATASTAIKSSNTRLHITASVEEIRFTINLIGSAGSQLRRCVLIVTRTIPVTSTLRSS